MALPVATVVVDAAVNWNAASAVAYGAGEITKKWIVQHGHVVASEFVKDALLSAPTGQAVTAAVTAATPAATATAATSITIGGLAATAAAAVAAVAVIAVMATLIYYAELEAQREYEYRAKAAAERVGDLWDAARTVVAVEPLKGWANTVNSSEAFKEVIAAIAATGGTAADVKTILPELLSTLGAAYKGSSRLSPQGVEAIFHEKATQIRRQAPLPPPNDIQTQLAMKDATIIFAALNTAGKITISAEGQLTLSDDANMDTILRLVGEVKGRASIGTALNNACASLGADTAAAKINLTAISKLTIPTARATAISAGRNLDRERLSAAAARDLVSVPGQNYGNAHSANMRVAAKVQKREFHKAQAELLAAIQEAARELVPAPGETYSGESDRTSAEPQRRAFRERQGALLTAMQAAARELVPTPGETYAGNTSDRSAVEQQIRGFRERQAAIQAAARELVPAPGETYAGNTSNRSSVEQQRRAFRDKQADMQAAARELVSVYGETYASNVSNRATVESQKRAFRERQATLLAAIQAAAREVVPVTGVPGETNANTHREAARAAAHARKSEFQTTRATIEAERTSLKKRHLRGVTALLHYLGLMKGQEPINDAIRYMRGKTIEQAEADANAGTEAPADDYQVDIAAAGLQLTGLSVSPTDIAAVKEMLRSKESATLGDIAKAAENEAVSLARARAQEGPGTAVVAAAARSAAAKPRSASNRTGVTPSGSNPRPSANGEPNGPSGAPNRYPPPPAAAVPAGLGAPPPRNAGLGAPPPRNAGLGLPPGYRPPATATGLGLPPGYRSPATATGLGLPPGYKPSATATGLGLGAPPPRNAGLGLPPGHKPPAAAAPANQQAEYERRQREARERAPAGVRVGWGRGGRKFTKRSSSRKLRTRRSSRRQQNATRRLRARVSR